MGLTCISHFGFIRLQNVRFRHSKSDLMGSFDRNAYWIHYKCLSRVMLYEHHDEHGQKSYVDITSTVKDLMKLKIVQWLITWFITHRGTFQCIPSTKEDFREEEIRRF